MELYKPSTIKYIQEKYGFKLTKSLGQNFLTDKNIIDKIVSGAGISINDIVVEIGPGIGVITQAAAEDAASVVAIEIDKNLIPILGETLSDYPNTRIVNQDVLKTDINEIIDFERARLENLNKEIIEELKLEGNREEAIKDLEEKNYEVKVIGNLPYYITTPIIMKILEDGVHAKSITCMMQKEVAERIKAKPGGKDYGALSVAVQYYCEVENVCNVPKEVFVPRPQVDSIVLRLDIREKPPVVLKDKNMFFSVVKAGFGMRRKTLSNSLMGVGGITKEQVNTCLEKAGIDPKRRAETLSLEEFASLANTVFEELNRN